MESLLSPKVCTALASSYCFDDLTYHLSHCVSEAHMRYPAWSIIPPLLLTFLCAWAITDVVEKRAKAFLVKNLSRGGLHKSDSPSTVGAAPSSSFLFTSKGNILSSVDKAEHGYVKVKASDY